MSEQTVSEYLRSRKLLREWRGVKLLGIGVYGYPLINPQFLDQPFEKIPSAGVGVKLQNEIEDISYDEVLYFKSALAGKRNYPKVSLLPLRQTQHALIYMVSGKLGPGDIDELIEATSRYDEIKNDNKMRQKYFGLTHYLDGFIEEAVERSGRKFGDE